MNPLSPWLTFYEIVGASAGALIGLQFVVMALVASLPHARAMGPGGATFVTPTVIHFCAALLLSGVMTVPWGGAAPFGTLPPVAVILGAVGLAGVVYSANIARRMRRTTVYRPEMEDWLFHAILPITGYATLLAAACTAPLFHRAAEFAVAAVSMLLLFIGIHNAWDIVTYHVFIKRESDTTQE